MDDKKVVADPNQPVAPSAVKPAVDNEVVVAEKDSRINNLQDQVKNLNIALLKAKGKVPNDGTAMNPEQMEEIADAAARKAIVESELFQVVREKDDILRSVLRENKELKVAAQNRSQIASPTGAGGSQPSDTNPVSFFTKEQEESLRKKGLDPVKVQESMMKNKQVSQVNI